MILINNVIFQYKAERFCFLFSYLFMCDTDSSCQKSSKTNIHEKLLIYLRNIKRTPCLHSLMQTREGVWENLKDFRVLANSLEKLLSSHQTCSHFQCSLTCGQGVKQRVVSCIDVNNLKVDEKHCASAPKPTQREACSAGSCEIHWFTSARWSKVVPFPHTNPHCSFNVHCF